MRTSLFLQWTQHSVIKNVFLRILLIAYPVVVGVCFTACNSVNEADGSVTEEVDGSVTVIMRRAGKLEPLLGDKVKTTKSLTISGPINGTDISCLRQMLQRTDEEEQERGVLSMLDLSGASIVKGGSWLDKTSEGEIGARMFSNCEGLEHILLPNDITKICDEAFLGCIGLTKVTIPDSVTTICDGAFYGCKCLTEIIIPECVTTIGNEAFKACTGLTEVILSDSVKSIGSHAFSYCRRLKEVTIGNNVTSLGSYAFAYCDGLTQVTLGKSISKIGAGAFDGCDGLKRITSLNPVPPNLSISGDGEWNGEGISYSAFGSWFIGQITKGTGDGVHFAHLLFARIYEIFPCVLYVPRGAKAAYLDYDWGGFEIIEM